MRTISAGLAATLLLPCHFAMADVGCLIGRSGWVPNGVTYTRGRTHAGQPCQIVLGRLGAEIEGVRTTVRPSHGILGSSAREGNRRYLAYVPNSGFVGLDRFEVGFQYTPPGRAPLTTRLNVEMNVAP